MIESESVSLKEYFEARLTGITQSITALEDKLSVALAASEKAVTKAEAASEKRFDAVNEFRRTLGDQAASFLQRETFDAFKERVSHDIDKTIESRHAEIRTVHEWAASENKIINGKITKLENSQSKLTGGLLLLSFVLPLLTIYLTSNGPPQVRRPAYDIGAVNAQPFQNERLSLRCCTMPPM
jgi:hypothetical protein